jgi:hypothetical protein
MDAGKFFWRTDFTAAKLFACRIFTATPRRLGWCAVATALTIKLILFAWGVHAFAFQQHPHETLWTIWSRWDAASYLHIADGFCNSQGLTKNQHDFLSHFPPFYPLVIKLVKSVSPFSTMMRS